ncbi:MAG: A/G-specific adenine glycosylase [Merismopediaceae bacterium]|nr:A/G-specific adenine glycosylase [Merismopediaceae bacterium]
MNRRQREELRSSLLTWYGHQGRDLPWRKSRDPYAIWISEIMLQQTQVKTVIPYYHAWLQQFPTVDDLAQAPLQTVLKVWEGLGYYARARNLHKTAQILVSQYQGHFPQTLEAVTALPGIGRTTAGGILSAAFNQPVAILDGNVKRVLARLMALPVPPQDALTELWTFSEALLDPEHSRDFNQALMDLGATVCQRSRPNCGECPWPTHCRAYNQGIQDQLPIRKMSAPLPHKQIGVAVIRNDQGQILIDRRPASGLLGGLWEFPGGKIEANETVEECIQREILEEIGIQITVGERLMTVNHAYTHFRVTLYVHLCEYVSGTPQAIECEEVRWVSLAEIDQFPFPKANTQIIDELKARLST